MQTGSELVQSGHYRSADIQRQMEEVSEAWEQLTEATTEKGRKLKDANELQVTCVLGLHVHVHVCMRVSLCDGGLLGGVYTCCAKECVSHLHACQLGSATHREELGATGLVYIPTVRTNLHPHCIALPACN